MANLTVDEAITKIRQFLDDTSTVSRWSEAQIRDALADAISACVTRYARQGGDRFDLETTGTTSASTGLLSISSVSPAFVKQVAIVEGNTVYKIPPRSPMRVGYTDLVARDLRILYVREYALSATGSHPLIGVGATEANSWRAFDKWVCLEAASQLALKNMEAERMAALQAATQKAEADAFARSTTPGGYETPRPERTSSYNAIGLTWQFVQPASIYLSRTNW